MKIIFIILVTVFIAGCDTAILEESYVPESFPLEIDDIELLIYISGERKETQKYRIKEESPYTVGLLFRTKVQDFDGKIENIVLKSPELQKYFEFKETLSFGEPSTNPHVAGYRFTKMKVSEEINIDFEATSKFTLNIAFDVKSNSKTITKAVKVVANKKLKSTSTLMANINGV